MTGRAPKTELFPYDWYDSPNIHFLTVLDFEALAQKENWRVERRIFLVGQSRSNAASESDGRSRGVSVFGIGKRGLTTLSHSQQVQS